MNYPLVSIVCVTHDRRELLLSCLNSCRSQDYPHKEILVLLNPGDPEVEAVLHATMPTVRIVRTHRNIGFFPGLNLAIANANGEFILTVDDDAYFLTDNVVSQMVQAFSDEVALGAVTSNVEGPYETTFSGEDRYVHVFRTGFTMVPKHAFTDWVGFYPDEFFRSAGETFLSMGLWENGKRVKCLVRARMFHETAIQGRSDADWKFYGIRSQALCVVMREPWFIVPLSLASKFVKSFVDFLRWGHSFTWLRAWWSVLIHLSYAFHLRRPISWKTYQLLHRLQNTVVTRLETS